MPRHAVLAALFREIYPALTLAIPPSGAAADCDKDGLWHPTGEQRDHSIHGAGDMDGRTSHDGINPSRATEGESIQSQPGISLTVARVPVTS